MANLLDASRKPTRGARGGSSPGRKLRQQHAAGFMQLPRPQDKEMELVFNDKTETIWLDGHKVEVDRAGPDNENGYQRPLEEERSEQYAANFNWGLFGTLIVNLREDGNYWIISGQHRLVAAVKAGHTRIPVKLYDGLTHDAEAFLFNQEADQRKNLTALDKFHSGVQAGFPDHVDVMNTVTDIGGKITYKSSPRVGNIHGITAVGKLLFAYDKAGKDLFAKALTILRDSWGLTGTAVKGDMIAALVQFLGTYSEGSAFGEVDVKKLVAKMQNYSAEKLEKDALLYMPLDGTQARFQAFVDLYNYKTQEHKRIAGVRPNWLSLGSKICTAPGCTTGPGDKPGKTYRRELCRQHYEATKAQV